MPFPGRELREYINDRFARLKREQAMLLGRTSRLARRRGRLHH